MSTPRDARTSSAAPELDTAALREDLGSWARGPALPAALLAQVPLPVEMAGARAELVAAAGTARAEPCVGDVIDGRYELLRLLGRGGMGVVFAARNRRTGQSVALKYIAAHYGAGGAQRREAALRMRREALAAGRIRHPNVVVLFDVGGDDDAPYLVMELLEGESLAQRMARARLGWDEAVGLIVPLLAGLAAAHAAGVIHRDLKPENVYLARAPDGRTVPKLLDFGVACLRNTSGELSGALTRTGGVIGTPAYMPLEQLTAGAVDARSDLFAICVVLYELLTGAFPHRASNAGELAVLRATEPPILPSSHGALLGKRREELLLKGLSRSPAARFQSAHALAEALQSTPAGSASRWLGAGAGGIVLASVALVWRLATPHGGEREPAAQRARPLEPHALAPGRPENPPAEAVTEHEQEEGDATSPTQAEPAPLPGPAARTSARARERRPSASERDAGTPADPRDIRIEDF